jgi:hypothetical protein
VYASARTSPHRRPAGAPTQLRLPKPQHPRPTASDRLAGTIPISSAGRATKQRHLFASAAPRERKPLGWARARDCDPLIWRPRPTSRRPQLPPRGVERRLPPPGPPSGRRRRQAAGSRPAHQLTPPSGRFTWLAHDPRRRRSPHPREDAVRSADTQYALILICDEFNAALTAASSSQRTLEPPPCDHAGED